MKIGIAGYTGRVGQLLVKELQSGIYNDLSLEAASSRSPKKEFFPVFASARDLFSACDCVIDYTTPDATVEHIQIAAEMNKKLVIGTTGLLPIHLEAINLASKKTAILQSANTSLGVNLLLALVEQAASKLGNDWDIEIFETHHRYKIDAPSGTALALGQAAAKGRGLKPSPSGRGLSEGFTIDRAEKRIEGQIGYAVSRGGDVVGEHMATFYGAGERIELGHKATDRAIFARGALTAAQFLSGKSTGLYTMRDVLGL